MDPVDSMTPWDAVLVPGGGLLDGGALPPWTIARLELALERRGNAPVICLSAGTPHKPRGPVTEARAAAEWLARRGVPVFEEAVSLDTIGNAYFARTIHTAPRQWRRLLVVTSAFHAPRCRSAFEWVFSLPGPDSPYEVVIDAAPDTGLSPGALTARRTKERLAALAVQPLAVRIRTMADLHAWLFTEHAAYATGLRSEPVTDSRLLESY